MSNRTYLQFLNKLHKPQPKKKQAELVKDPEWRAWFDKQYAETIKQQGIAVMRYRNRLPFMPKKETEKKIKILQH